MYGPHVWGGAAPRRGVGFPQSGSGPRMCGGAGPGSGLSLPGARSGPWEQVGSSRAGQVPQEQVRSPESGSGPGVPSWLGPPEAGQPLGASRRLVLVVLPCGRHGGPDRPGWRGDRDQTGSTVGEESTQEGLCSGATGEAEAAPGSALRPCAPAGALRRLCGDGATRASENRLRGVRDARSCLGLGPRAFSLPRSCAREARPTVGRARPAHSGAVLGLHR